MTKEEMNYLTEEVELMKLLKHPNIVNYLETISTKDFLYIVLEYVENGSLASILKMFGAFSEQVVSIYTLQVLDGLAYLHEQGVIHRDIKGANILITKEGTVKLADFGVAARVADDSDRASSASPVGTPYWMAPEMIRVLGRFTTASDIWSFGCTVIELLTGEPPYFDLAPMSALYRMVQDEHPPLPADISPVMRDFCLKCFEKAPELRPTAAEMMQHALMTSTKARITLYPAASADPAELRRRASVGEMLERPDVIVSDAVRMLQKGQTEEARERFERAREPAAQPTLQLAPLSPTSVAVAMTGSHVTPVRGDYGPLLALGVSSPSGGGGGDGALAAASDGVDDDGDTAGGGGGGEPAAQWARGVDGLAHEAPSSPGAAALALADLSLIEQALAPPAVLSVGSGQSSGGLHSHGGTGGGGSRLSSPAASGRPSMRGTTSGLGSGLGLGLGDARADELSRRLEPFVERPSDESYTTLLLGGGGGAPRALAAADRAGLGGVASLRGAGGGGGGGGADGRAAGAPDLRARLAARMAGSWHREADGGVTDYFVSVPPPSERENVFAQLERQDEARRSEVRALIVSLSRDPLRGDAHALRADIVHCLARLEQRPQLAADFAHEHGLVPFVELLQAAGTLPATQQAALVEPLLQLANVLAASRARHVCENLCLLGAVPAVAGFVGAYGLSALAHERISRFLNAMCRAGPATLALLVAADALPVIVRLLEPDEHPEQTALALDSLWRLFQVRSWQAPRSDFCRLLGAHGVLVPLARALHIGAQRSQREGGGVDGKYAPTVAQVAELLLLFSHADVTAARGMLSHGVLQDVLRALFAARDFAPKTVLTVLKCVKNLSMGPAGHVDALQRAGAIETLVVFLDSVVDEAPCALEMRGQVLLSLYHLCKLSRNRQEKAVLCPNSKGIVPHLQDAVARSQQLKHVALPMLCDVARASKRSRTELWKHSGARRGAASRPRRVCRRVPRACASVVCRACSQHHHR
jgi:hypothetical protein